jgi:hypothetical protein
VQNDQDIEESEEIQFWHHTPLTDNHNKHFKNTHSVLLKKTSTEMSA